MRVAALTVFVEVIQGVVRCERGSCHHVMRTPHQPTPAGGSGWHFEVVGWALTAAETTLGRRVVRLFLDLHVLLLLLLVVAMMHRQLRVALHVSSLTNRMLLVSHVINLVVVLHLVQRIKFVVWVERDATQTHSRDFPSRLQTLGTELAAVEERTLPFQVVRAPRVMRGGFVLQGGPEVAAHRRGQTARACSTGLPRGDVRLGGVHSIHNHGGTSLEDGDLASPLAAAIKWKTLNLLYIKKPDTFLIKGSAQVQIF